MFSASDQIFLNRISSALKSETSDVQCSGINFADGCEMYGTRLMVTRHGCFSIWLCGFEKSNIELPQIPEI